MKEGPVLQLVTDNTHAARAHRWHRRVLRHHCPTCHAPIGQRCRMGNPRPRPFHLTRATKAYRALRNQTRQGP
jgi:hypothetical protein